MNKRINIEQELVELNSLLPADLNKPVFGLPDDYFENFASSVLERLKEENTAISTNEELSELSPLLAGLPKKTPFHVPETYFNSLADDIPAIIGDEKLPERLQDLDRKLPYQVPADYFSHFAGKMLEQVAPKQAKVVPLRTRWMRMAAAAVVTGLLVMSGYFYFNRNTTNPEAQSQEWVAKHLKGISDKDLEEFVNTAEPAGNEVAQSGNAAKEVRTMLQDVSTSEMDAFLAQMPTDDEDLSIIN